MGSDSIAVTAFKNSRVPYSHRASGACLVTDKGDFAGAAVEYCNYTNSLCAPTTAVLSAIAGGANEFKSLEVYTSASIEEPCGRCLEFLNEFCPRNLPIVIIRGHDNSEGNTKKVSTTLAEMLPHKQSGQIEHFRQKSKEVSLVTELVAHVSSLEVKVVNPNVIAHLERGIIDRLCKEAVKVCAHAFIPVSSFPVGAALLDEKNNIISGVNVEHSIIGLGLCAERTAITRAISMGSKRFKAVAVVLPKSMDYGRPCGACRQSLVEFGKYDVLQIKIVNGVAEVYATTTYDLLPHAFSPDSL